jgi:hypothetical protein
MFGVRGEADAIWISASLSLYGLGLIVYWLAGAGRSSTRPDGARDEVAEKVAAALAAGGQGSSAVAMPSEPEMVVEPSRTEPIVIPAKPTPYAFRGFTLYERSGKHFFSKGKPPGATAVTLPEGYEAKWDKKKDRPLLVEVAAAPEEEMEVVTQTARKPCSAMTAPGEFCTNDAKEGSRYCGRHANYQGPADSFEVHKPGTSSGGKSPKVAAPTFEVRLARPTPPKPLNAKRSKPTTVEVRLAKPSNTKPLSFTSGKAAEMRTAKPTAKPVKPGKPSTVEVRVAKPSNLPQPKGKKAKSGPAKAPQTEVRRDIATPSKKKGKQLGASEVIIRKPGTAKPAAPLRVAPADVVVKSASDRKSTPQTLKVAESEIVVVKDTKRRTMLGVAGNKPKDEKGK